MTSSTSPESPAPVCAVCDSRSLTPIIDFGAVALAGAFVTREEFETEKTYPLRLCFCDDCWTVQVIDHISASVLFENYFYFSSSIRTLREHFVGYAEEVARRFLSPDTATAIEFGCNDGVLLRPLADQGIRTVIGVDPATNVVETINDPRVTVVNDFFGERVAELLVAQYGQADLVAANNVYAHLPDIQDITRGVRRVLRDDGVFVFEVHYLGSLVDELQYDMVYHEHLYYHSLLSLTNHFDRYDMEVFDVKPIPIHAGSMRYYVCKKGSRHSSMVTDAVRALRAEELRRGFDRPETFSRFADQVAQTRTDLLALMDQLKADGARIVGYGASGRANTVIQYCGLDQRYLDYVIDDAPAKVGFYTPGSHLLIRPGTVLDESNPPEYVLLFAWSFIQEIAEKQARYLSGGGKMIVPLPAVRVVASGSV